MTISAPGKILIAGEWSILELGNSSMVAAVDRKVYVDIKESNDEKIHIRIREFNIKNISLTFEKNRLQLLEKINKKDKILTSFIRAAIEITLRYLVKFKPFKIESISQELSIKKNNIWQKIGLGSSAATVVATVAAILKFNGVDINKKNVRKKIYKLSAMAHYLAQGKIGSGFDIAASTFGGLFLYKRFNPNFLIDQMKNDISIKEIVDSEWPNFYFKNFKVPNGFNLVIGWTRKEAPTSTMIKKIYRWKIKNGKEFRKIFGEINVLVQKLILAWKKMDKKMIVELIRNNEEKLRELGSKSKVKIETEKLKKMSIIANKFGWAGKLSGAGGGDCGIAISFNKRKSGMIKREWRKNNIYIVDADISSNGVK